MISTALTVAGSDSSGGAGIQADLQTFARFGVYGMSVIAGLTAQNSIGVKAAMDVPAEFVKQQWDAVMSDMPVGALKTGMLANAANVHIAATMIAKYGVKQFVLDPVLVSTSGTALLAANAIETLKRELIPLALLVTPNTHEAAVLAGLEVEGSEGMEAAARRIHQMGAAFVLVKGGHLEGDAVDVLFDGREFRYYRLPRIDVGEVHGTGCVLSAAITAGLALGNSVYDAVRQGKEFVTEAIATSRRIGKGSASCNAAGLGSVRGLYERPKESGRS